MISGRSESVDKIMASESNRLNHNWSAEKQKIDTLSFLAETQKIIGFGDLVWFLNPLYPVTLFKTKINKKFCTKDAQDALKIICEKYGKETPAIIERIYRSETGHFTSRQFVNTGTGGMEAFGDPPYYEWDSSFFLRNPDYVPVGTWAAFENAGLSGLGGNSRVTHSKKIFIIFPSVLAAMEYLVDYIKRYDGNWGRWHSSDEKVQLVYREYILKIRPKFTEEF